MLFIHSVGTKSLHILLGELPHFFCHFIWVKLEFPILMLLCYMLLQELGFLVAIFASASAVSLSLISLWAEQ